MINHLTFQYNDGGREAAGYKGRTGDCVTRAIAIATGVSYQEVYDSLNALSVGERRGKRKRGVSNARTGVYKAAIHKYLAALGWKWTPTMGIGTGCKVHMRVGEIPKGVVILSVSKHLVTVVDDVIQDTFDPSRLGTRCVYGYWQKA